jgi:hypothetical protein
VEPGGGDDDVRIEVGTRTQGDPGLRERVDLVGDDRRRTIAQGGEQVAVRDQAQSLVPRVVARRQVVSMS